VESAASLQYLECTFGASDGSVTAALPGIFNRGCIDMTVQLTVTLLLVMTSLFMVKTVRKTRTVQYTGCVSSPVVLFIVYPNVLLIFVLHQTCTVSMKMWIHIITTNNFDRQLFILQQFIQTVVTTYHGKHSQLCSND